MYLESIKLFNFRLFRHELLTDRFSPGLNIFVGPNGSGKSSFFNSIYLLIYGKLFDIEKELCLMLKNIPSIDKKYIFLYMHGEKIIKKKAFYKWTKLIC